MRCTLILFLAVTCSLAARPLRAQAPADTTGLAQAVASTLTESVLILRGQVGPTIVWKRSGTPLDSAVAAILFREPRVRVRESGLVNAFTFSIHNAAVSGDSARITVDEEQTHSFTGEFQFYLERNDYLFQRTDGRWRFVRRVFVLRPEGGPVRDDGSLR